jgi:predicted transcriptional regulator
MSKTKLFIRSKLRKGYSVAVRDDIEEAKIIRRHIDTEHKELYIKEFGHDLISDSRFFEWWCKLNNCKPENVSYPLTLEDAKKVVK